MQIKTGEKYRWQSLKQVSENLGIKPKKVPDPNYDSVNSYHKKVWKEVYGIAID